MDLKCYRKKYKIAKQLNAILKDNQIASCSGCRYELYYLPGHEYIREYTINEYGGGAIAPRNANGNSSAEIMRTIGNLVYGGYYDEVKEYNNIQQNDEWLKYDFEKEEFA